MVSYAENTVYLTMGGTAVQAYFKDVQLSPSNSAVDITTGAGVDHVQRAPGLNDTSISITLAYDLTDVQTYIQKIAAGQTISIEYGPESNVSGKPRHVQNFVITGADHQVSVDKSSVTFNVVGEGAAAPSVDMFTGGVYS